MICGFRIKVATHFGNKFPPVSGINCHLFRFESCQFQVRNRNTILHVRKQEKVGNSGAWNNGQTVSFLKRKGDRDGEESNNHAQT